MPTDTVRPELWTYAPDVGSASRPSDEGSVVLIGEAPSTRQRTKQQFGPADWQPGLPTLTFRLQSNRFHCEFSIERQNAITNDALANSHDDNFHIIWKIDYAALRVGVDGAGPIPASELSYSDWLEVDMLLLGVLGDWPTRPDEAKWIKSSYRSGRVIYALGGWTGGAWDAELMRTREKMGQTSWPHLVRYFDISIGYRTHVDRGWRRSPLGIGMVNAGTRSGLTFKDRWSSSPGPHQQSRTVFQFDAPGFDLLIPVLIPSSVLGFGPYPWVIRLAHAFLLLEGWNLDQICSIRSDVESHRAAETLKRIALQPLEAATLVNGLIDAVLHWQTMGGIEPPPSVRLSAVTNEGAFWPYDSIGAGL